MKVERGGQKRIHVALFVLLPHMSLRAIAYNYRESHDRTENSDFFLLRQKDPFGELFSEIYF